MRPGTAIMELSADKGASLDALIASADVANHPGVALAIIQEGRTVYLRCGGAAQIEFGAPVTPSTIFRIGSVTKHMVATLLLMLEDEGLVDLDAPAARYVPELPSPTHAITVRALLNMTSGFPDAVAMTIFAGVKNLAMTRDQHFRLTLRTDRLQHEPGAQSLYSNTNYLLASEIIERVSGQSLGEVLKARLFRPLGLNAARLHAMKAPVAPNVAEGYVASRDGGFERTQVFYEMSGDGGVDMHMSDFISWFLAYRQGGFARDFHRRITEEAVLNDGARTGYGLGMSVAQTAHGLLHAHAGGMPGFLADFRYWADADLGVLMLSNWFEPSLLSIADKVADIMLGASRVPAPASTLPAGLYFNETRAMLLEIDADGVAWLMGERSPLVCKDGRFHSTKPGDVFSITERGPDALELAFGAGERVDFLRWVAPSEAPATDLEGRFRNAQLVETHVVTTRDGGLEVRVEAFFRELSWRALTHRGGDTFSAPIPDEPTETNLMLRFVRDDAGVVVGFFYSTYRARDIWFERISA